MLNISIDKIIRIIQELRDYKIRNQKIHILCYVDKTILIADNENNLQYKDFYNNLVAEQKH